jgi:hypothetical protein
MDTLRMLLRASLPILSLAASACGHGGGPEVVTGTISGKTFSPVEAISSPFTVDYTPGGAAILLSTGPGLCDMLSAETVPASLASLMILVASYDTTSMSAVAPTKPGDFVVVVPQGGGSPRNGASAQYEETDAGCNGQKLSNAVGGTVTLASVMDDAYGGTADLKLDTGDEITVTFQSQKCAALNMMFDSSWSPTCK